MIKKYFKELSNEFRDITSKKNIDEKGLYVTLVRLLLTVLKFFLIGKWITSCARMFTMLSYKDDAGELRAKAFLIEIYQFLYVILLHCIYFKIEDSYYSSSFSLCHIFVFYRIFEIAIFSVGWLLNDDGPIHGYKRSFISFSINLVELSTAFSILGLKHSFIQDKSTIIWDNIGHALSFTNNSLAGIFSTWYLIQSGFIIIFLLGIVVSGMNREAVPKQK